MSTIYNGLRFTFARHGAAHALAAELRQPTILHEPLLKWHGISVIIHDGQPHVKTEQATVYVFISGPPAITELEAWAQQHKDVRIIEAVEFCFKANGHQAPSHKELFKASGRVILKQKR